MSRLRAIFLCGHNSPYGLSHLSPLLDSRFEIISIVIAPRPRWDKFYTSLNGKQYSTTDKNLYQKLKVEAKQILPDFILRHLIKSETPALQLAQLSKAYNITIQEEFDVNSDEFIKKIGMLKPDLIISAAYPQIFKDQLLSVPKMGCVNFHPSLLPEYRGAHPHFWAIAKGEATTGVTAHFMATEIDMGDIIAQREIEIDNCYYHELYRRIMNESAHIVKDVEAFFYDGTGKRIPQNPDEGATFRQPRTIHKRIFWNLQSAEDIYNLIRTEQAFCFFNREKISIKEAHLKQTNRNMTNNIVVENGTIVDIGKDAVVVQAMNGFIHISSFGVGGKRIDYKEWVYKNKITIGEKFL